MKPVYLEFCGLNSFSQKAVINFEKLLSGGLFGIFGDTGSGKSTILDAIHLALYGKVDRASGAQTDCINYRKDSAYVIFDFDITYQGVRKRYRTHRERKRKTGGSKAYLYEKRGEEWLALADGEREVDTKLSDIIGLTFEEFKKCIALPQGEFAGLVKSQPAERMRLVSRLFDLEKYGENLSRSVRAKCDDLAKEIEVLEGRLEENADGKEENIAQKQAELEGIKLALAEAEKALSSAQAAVEKLSREYEEKLVYQTLCAEVDRLEHQKGYYLALQSKLGNLATAESLVAQARAIKGLSTERQTAAAKAQQAAVSQAAAEAEKTALEKAIKESGFDEQVWRIEEQLNLLKKAEGDLQLLKAAEENYQNCLKKYKQIVADTRDFVGLIAATEKQLADLDQARSFEEYLTAHFKQVLLKEERKEMRTDLTKLQEEYPVITPSVQVLIAKYSGEEGEVDFRIEEARAAYDRIEKQRKALQEQAIALKADQAAEQARAAQKEAIKKEGQVYHAQIDTLSQRVKEAVQFGDEPTLQTKKKQLLSAKEKQENSLAAAVNKYTAALAEKEKQTGLAKAYEAQEKVAREELTRLLSQGTFTDVAAAEALLKEIPDGKKATEEVQAFFGALTAKTAQKSAYPVKDWTAITAAVVENARETQAQAKKDRDTQLRALSALESQLVALEEKRKKCQEIEAQVKDRQAKRNLWEQIHDLVKRNQFLDFIASEYLQEICADASRTLLSLSGGKYFLTYAGDFKIGDNLNGGNLRAVRTLSGGETFLVSLSLALSLSNAICQKSMRPIEFFFLDEGFGTLDEKLIDTVMNVLGKLIGNHFFIGLISHVEELKQRIENKVLVTGATETESSQVKVIAY